jgi:hypothetical protein
LAGKRKKPKSSGKSANTSGETNGALIPQKHGGALLAGGKVGHKGAGGRPSNEVRERFLGVVSDLGPDLAREVAMGRPVQNIRLRVASLLPHIKCNVCGAAEIKLAKPDDLDLEITVETTASVRDRLAAVDQAARYGLGALREVTVQNVRERLKGTLEKLQQHTSAEQFAAIVKEIRPIWE